MSKQSVKNAEKRFRQGRITLKKLKSLVLANNLAATQAHVESVSTEVEAEELTVEEHEHSDNCHHH